MTKIYIGYVEEVIYDNEIPTMELRVRIPTLHGLSEKSGLKTEELPIASPMFTPGIRCNKQRFEEALQSINKVYVIFEAGDENKPVYFGLKGNSELYDIPFESSG